MGKKLNNKVLLAVFIGLTAVFLATNYFRNNKRTTKIDTDLIAMDTALVSHLTIYPTNGNKEAVVFTKQTDHWEVQSGALKSTLREGLSATLLSELAKMKIKRLVAKTENKWEKYQVTDASATRLEVEETGKGKVLDIYLGKIQYEQPTGGNNRFGGGNQFSGSTYVRLGHGPEVYEVEGFLPMIFNRDFNSWRNNAFIAINKDDVTQLRFRHRETHFVLAKTDSLWSINDATANTAKVDQYLGLLAHQQNTDFADDYSPAGTPDYSLDIRGNNMNNIQVNCFKEDSSGKFYMESSLHPKVYFRSDATGLFQQLFVTEDYFLE